MSILSKQQEQRTVGIWIRVSTEDQAKGESPEHHEQRARYYAEARGWTVGEVYHLEAVSGKTVMEHPETKRMLKDIRAKKIGGLIFSKLARLARNTKELLEFADLFRAADADLISLQESIDTSTPAGRLFYTMIAAMAQWEREEIADRVSASVMVRAKLGKPLNGKIPFGYQWKDKRIMLHPTEGPIRKLMYELFLEYRRNRAVARMLNERGCRTREGRKFTGQFVERTLRDPTAKGMHRANYTAHAAGGKFRAVKPESEWVWTKVDPIVSEEVWNTCNQHLDERLKNRKLRPAKVVKHLFAGLTYCSCGKKMYVFHKTGKYECVPCRRRIPSMDLEACYMDQLTGFFLSPEKVSAELAHANEAVTEQRALLSALEIEQAKVREEMTRAYQLYTGKHIEAADFEELYKPLRERSRQLDDELPRRQAAVDVLQVDHLSSDFIVSETRELSARWPTLDYEEKRKIVETLTDRITVGDGEIDISLCGKHPFETNGVLASQALA